MIRYEIPGREEIEIENIIFDYNGTLAVDGNLIDGVYQLINELSKVANIYILTADTYGTVKNQCKTINAEVLTFPNDNAGYSKREIIKRLGGNNTLCVGNGFNDILMFRESILSIAVIEGEGVSAKLLIEADIVCRSIIETLEIILNGNMIKASLRN